VNAACHRFGSPALVRENTVSIVTSDAFRVFGVQ
jgi:hypothetical protein